MIHVFNSGMMGIRHICIVTKSTY